MQNKLSITLIELAPALFILLLIIFVLLQQLKQKNAKSVDDLREQYPEKWKKIIRRSALVKLLGWCLIGLIWIGIVALNLSNIPKGIELTGVLMS
ncbi:MAG: hypothetical protein M3Q33_15515, partial [Acidobacteriota bacterium]|nr:hypothetical protein [Acidobacteriota bacterium]